MDQVVRRRIGAALLTATISKSVQRCINRVWEEWRVAGVDAFGDTVVDVASITFPAVVPLSDSTSAHTYTLVFFTYKNDTDLPAPLLLVIVTLEYRLHHCAIRSNPRHSASTTVTGRSRSLAMGLFALAGTSLVALEHVYIMILEMFLWTTPRGRKAFDLTPDFANQTRNLAANQGLYNGFLAAGLLWALIHPDGRVATQLQTFFLGCVVIAGIFGAATANKKILFMQALPAAMSLGFVLLGI